MGLNALERDKQALKARIQAAKQNNVTKLSELKQTLNAYPAIVSTLILYIEILHVLIYALGRSSNPPQIKNLMSMWVSFLEKKAASAMQKSIVPWNIATPLLILCQEDDRQGDQGPADCNDQYRKSNAQIS